MYGVCLAVFVEVQERRDQHERHAYPLGPV